MLGLLTFLVGTVLLPPILTGNSGGLGGSHGAIAQYDGPQT
jgi:hypothetical protein